MNIFKFVSCIIIAFMYCVSLFPQEHDANHYVEKEWGEILDYYEPPKAPNNFDHYLDSIFSGLYSTTIHRGIFFAFYVAFASKGDLIDTNKIGIYPIYNYGNKIPSDSYIWNEFTANIKASMKNWKLKHYNKLRKIYSDTLVADSIEKALKIPPKTYSVSNNIVLKLSFGYEPPFNRIYNTILSGFKSED